MPVPPARPVVSVSRKTASARSKAFEAGIAGEHRHRGGVEAAEAAQGHVAVQRLEVDVVLDQEELAALVLHPAARGSAPREGRRAAGGKGPALAAPRGGRATSRSSRAFSDRVSAGAPRRADSSRPGPRRRPAAGRARAPSVVGPAAKAPELVVEASRRHGPHSGQLPRRPAPPRAAAATARARAASSHSRRFVWFRWMKSTRPRERRGQPGQRSRPRTGAGSRAMLAAGQLARVVEGAVEEGDVHRGHLVLEPAVPALPLVDVGDVEERSRRPAHADSPRCRSARRGAGRRWR